jgi:alginate O-acetyltransferase complex protein AlgI
MAYHTLSRFLKDYIYIPLGGNRLGSFRTYSNLMATFILGGLWHGAGWTFIFWGFLHGFALVIHRVWQKLGFRLWTWLAWFITFNFINIAWVFFRAKEWDDAMKVLGGMVGFGEIMNKYAYEMFQVEQKYSTKNIFQTIGGDSDTIKFIVSGFIIILLFKSSNNYLNSFKLSYFNLIILTLMATISILYLNRMSEFLYFNF